MKAVPFVSIVINNYNYGRFLREAIDSALAQQYAPLEVVVVDDGSTDQSRDIIASYGDQIIPVLKENGGQASAFNAGFAASLGDVVIFLDADDVLLATAASSSVNPFVPGVSKVYWPLWEMDANGTLLGTLIPGEPLPEGDFRERLIAQGPIACRESPTSGNAWSREFLNAVLPMPEREFTINSDCYLSTLAPVYGEIRTLAESQSRYRVHGKNHYVLMTVGEKSKRQFDMYVRRCELLSAHLQHFDVKIDPRVWQDGNWHYEYLERVWLASEEMAALMPEGSEFIFVDDGSWGDGRPGTQAVAGRSAIPFLERNGMYNGRPANDESAISELERLRSELHPAFLIIIWPAFWWMDYYVAFASHVRETFPCVISNEHIMAFDLSSSLRNGG